MIGPAQLKLLERARQALGHTQADLMSRVSAWGWADRIEDLTDEGYERVLNIYTWLGFRDRSRPILSRRTRSLIAGIQSQIHLTNFNFLTIIRAYGHVSDLRDLTGTDLINLLSGLEKYGLDVERFIADRRQITTKQIGLLQIARKQTGMSNEEYSDDLIRLGGVHRTGDLDSRGFDLMLTSMEVAGFERAPPAKPIATGFGRRPGFASPEQVELIRTLWREWTGPSAESEASVEAGLNAWLERYHGASSLRFLTTPAAGKVITSLRAMKARKASTREAHHA